MDMLHQCAALVHCVDRSVWRAAVSLGDWQQTLTFLRVPASRLWGDPQARPEPCSGTIEPLRDDMEEGTPASDVQDPSVLEDSAATAPADEEALSHPVLSAEQGLPTWPGVEPGSAAEEANITDAVENEGQDLGQQFLTWLEEGLKSGGQPINAVNARVHRVKEGLLLVSPAIFKDFATARSVQWTSVQKRFQKLKLHQKTPDGFNIWTYQVVGERRKNQLKGIVIEAPERILKLDLPGPNPHVTLRIP